MKLKILGALIAAPIIVFSGVALAWLNHGVEGYLGLDTISINDNVCQITSRVGDGPPWCLRRI